MKNESCIKVSQKYVECKGMDYMVPMDPLCYVRPECVLYVCVSWKTTLFYLQRSLRKFVIVMCMMTEIQDLEGVQKRCPPKEDQTKKNVDAFKKSLDKGEIKLQQKVDNEIRTLIKSNTNIYL